MPVLQGNYLFQSNWELQKILPVKYGFITLNDPLLNDIMPIRSIDAAKLIWAQRDSFTGFMAPRLPNAGFQVVPQQGINWFEADPGHFGESMFIDEVMLEKAAQFGTVNGKIDLAEQQQLNQELLLSRLITTVKICGWNFATTGKYNFVNQDGAVLASATQSLQPFQVAVPWSNFTVSTPLNDLRQMQTSRELGQSVSFGRDSNLYLARPDVNNLLQNNNPADLGSFRVVLGIKGQMLPLSLPFVNEVFTANDLPQIVPWDDNYLPDGATSASQAIRFIQPGYGTVIGKRLKGEPVAEFLLTLNAATQQGFGKDQAKVEAPGLSNMWMDFEWEKRPPRGITTCSWNGGPAIYYPGSVVPFQPETTGGGEV